MSENISLYSKEGFEFNKIKENNYKLVFDIENQNIVLPKIVDFSLLKLIYELNKDIYENSNLTIINENEAISMLLIKNLFEDLGLHQRFSYIKIEKVVSENNILFISKSIKTSRPQGIPICAKLLPINIMLCNVSIINSHKINFCCDITFDDEMIVPKFAEQIVGVILFKIFKRVKQFIENI
jgi:hypothetical protein